MPRTLAIVLVVASSPLFVACGDEENSTGATQDPSATSGVTGGAGGEPGTGGAGASGSASGGMSTSSSASSGVAGGSRGCGTAETAGTFDETLDVGGAQRAYRLVVPDGLDGMTPVPIILGFHGFNGTGEAASQYFGLTGSEPALYVYPQALPLPGQNGGVGWDMEPDGVDVAFFDALVASLAAAHCVDEARIYSAGHSHGASFSNHLGCYRADVITAITPVAGGGPWAGPCMGSVSAMLVHGTNDTDVPLTTGESSRDHWLDANGCPGAASMPVDPSPCIVYDGCAEPVRWCQHDGGHEWPDFAGAGIRAFFLGN